MRINAWLLANLEKSLPWLCDFGVALIRFTSYTPTRVTFDPDET